MGKNAFQRTTEILAALSATTMVLLGVSPASAAAADTPRLSVDYTPMPVNEVEALLRQHTNSSDPTALSRSLKAATSSWGTDPNPADYPSFCNESVQPSTRVTACSAGTVTAGLEDPKTHKVLGVTQTAILYWAELSTKSRGWYFNLKAIPVSASGVMDTGTMIAADPVCTNGCQVAGGSSTPVAFKLNQPLKGQWAISSDGGEAKSTLESSQTPRFTFTNPAGPGPVQQAALALPTVRCDNDPIFGPTYPGGCVYTASAPTFQLDGAADPASPQHAAFVADAQNRLAGHPGRPDGTPLHRITDEKAKNANRAASCKGFVKNSADDSCDEYPYASTKEGGTTGKVSVGHVPSRDNSNGGVKLNTFYIANRVLNGDAFYVQVVK
ncbi:NucA/NucB deoxyribonuclease domain-containing protein [Streptomyces sp. NPDC003753]